MEAGAIPSTLAAITISLAACGGDNSTGSVSEEPPSETTTQQEQTTDAEAHQGKSTQKGQTTDADSQQGKSTQKGQTTDAEARQGKSTKTEFIKHADEICARSEKSRADFQAQFQKALQEGETARAAQLLRQAADSDEDAAAELRNLEVPPGNEAVINRWLSINESLTAVSRDYADALAADDRERKAAVGETLLKRVAASNKIAREYGFKICGT